MNIVMMWRVGEQSGDRVLALLMLLISIGLALSMASDQAFESAEARDRLAGLGGFAALLLAFRYAFAGARAWILIVDAKRAQLPSLPGRVLRIEALRAAVFALLPALPFAFAGSLPVAASILAASLAGLSIGVLFGVTPYRFSFLPVGGVFALLIVNQSGLLAWSTTDALLAATVLAACSGLFLFWRIATMAAAPIDAAVGGAYSVAQAIGRHAGSIWTAPNSAPLPAMLKARRRGTTPQMLVALLGGPVAGRLASPGRDLRDWTLTLGLFPVLMTGAFVSFAALDGAAMPAIQRIFGMIWPAVVLTWVPFGAVAFLWMGTFRQARAHLRPGHPVREAMHVLPGVPADPRAWRRQLQPLIWAPLAVGVALLLSTIPLIPDGAMRGIPLVTALLMVGLVGIQPAVAVSTSASVPARAALGAAVSALLLLALYLWAGVGMVFDVMRAS